MLCPKCKIEMTEKVGDYPYVECGLEDVVLSDLTIYECTECGGQAPSIPNVLSLHDHIAERIVAKDSLLTAKEIRFLRKELGLKEVELANYLGVNKVTVSRWETGESSIDSSYDRLLRLFYVNKKIGVSPAALALYGKSIRRESPPEPQRIIIPSALLQAAI